MTELLVALFLKALLVLVIAKATPGVRIGGFGAAVGVAVVYAMLTWALKGFLIYVSWPFILVTMGLFLLVLNAFLLWITDKVVSSFEIKGFPGLALMTIGITAGTMAIDHIVPRLF